VAFNVGEVAGLVLTAGSAAMLTAFLAGVKDLRKGAAAGRREVVRDLMEWRDDLDEARKCAQSDADFWRDLAGERGGQLRDRGIVPANPYPVPPSQRGDAQAGATARRNRRKRRTTVCPDEQDPDDEERE
jgi:hypothetical protein